MKKILFMIPLMAMALTSCDPSVDEISPVGNISAEALTNSLQIKAQSEGNNNLTIYTSPTRYINVYDSDGNKLGEGTEVEYQVLPPTTSLSIYCETMNEDGTTTTSGSKDVTVSEYTDVPEQYTELFGSTFAATKFGWNTEASDGVMGNGAYLENVGPGWWVISAGDLDGQAAGWGIPNQGIDATMTVGPGSMTTPAGSGAVKFNFNAITKPGWDIGTLNCTNIYPLCGVNPNAGATPFYEYHILKIDEGQLRLCAPEPGSGDWGTAWFWNYKKVQ